MFRKERAGFWFGSLKFPWLGVVAVVVMAKERRKKEMFTLGSVRSNGRRASRIVSVSDEDEDEDDSVSGSGSGDDEVGDDDDEDDDEDDNNGTGEYVADARSIKSFESMMSSRRRETKRSAKDVADAARKSLSDRLAKVSSGIMVCVGYQDSVTTRVKAVFAVGQ
ncbi:hypothetical protein MPER_03642 [Moniliophthora perniciosa FA553]|nr:hypothetical protein MPER_03642 [Moniliophthora perniciosa FA553]